MSIEVKPGRWRMRNGETVIVVDYNGVFRWPWRGYHERDQQPASWARDGQWGGAQGPFDLVEYLGPEEPQATS